MMSSSPVLDLPPKLQNRTYKMVLVKGFPDLVSVQDPEALKEERDSRALQSTGYGIRAIAKPVYY